MYTAYNWVHGNLHKVKYTTLEIAIKDTNNLTEEGEHFPSCIVDNNNIIVHDFEAETEVIGVESPMSRVGEEFIL